MKYSNVLPKNWLILFDYRGSNIWNWRGPQRNSLSSGRKCRFRIFSDGDFIINNLCYCYCKKKTTSITETHLKPFFERVGGGGLVPALLYVWWFKVVKKETYTCMWSLLYKQINSLRCLFNCNLIFYTYSVILSIQSFTFFQSKALFTELILPLEQKLENEFRRSSVGVYFS